MMWRFRQKSKGGSRGQLRLCVDLGRHPITIVYPLVSNYTTKRSVFWSQKKKWCDGSDKSLKEGAAANFFSVAVYLNWGVSSVARKENLIIAFSHNTTKQVYNCYAILSLRLFQVQLRASRLENFKCKEYHRRRRWQLTITMCMCFRVIHTSKLLLRLEDVKQIPM
jgi:hypothetical protein